MIRLGTQCSPPPLQFVGCGVARFFFTAYFKTQLERWVQNSAPGWQNQPAIPPPLLPVHTPRRGRTCPTSGPLFSPVQCSPLAPRDGDCTAGESWSWDGKLGRRGRKPEPLNCYYWRSGIAVEKTCVKSAQTLRRQGCDFWYKIEGSHSNRNVPILCSLLRTWNFLWNLTRPPVKITGKESFKSRFSRTSKPWHDVKFSSYFKEKFTILEYFLLKMIFE